MKGKYMKERIYIYKWGRVRGIKREKLKGRLRGGGYDVYNSPLLRVKGRGGDGDD